MLIVLRLLILFVFTLLVACSSSKGGPPAGMAMSVSAVQASNKAVEKIVKTVGTLQANEDTVIQSELDETVQEVLFIEGQKVEKGQQLIILNQTKQKAQFNESKAKYRLAKQTYSRSKQLFEAKTISSQEFDKATSDYESAKAALAFAEEQFENTVVKAPYEGIVGARLVSPGQYVKKGDAITSIVSISSLKLETRIPQRYVSSLHVDMPVNVTVDAYPSEKFKGTTFFVSPSVDDKTRSTLIKAIVDNSEQKLKAGMFASVETVLSVNENAVVIPETALMMLKDSKRVYVAKDDKAELRVVKVGRQLEGEVEIVSGLDVGELVITEGIQLLRPGAPIKITNQETNKSA